MPTLHLVTKSPYASNALTAALARAMPGDYLLLIEDGVMGVGHPTLLATTAHIELYVLREDLAARGLPDTHINKKVKLADYQDFVAFACICEPCLTWI